MDCSFGKDHAPTRLREWGFVPALFQVFTHCEINASFLTLGFDGGGKVQAGEGAKVATALSAVGRFEF
jgi:hypothetical protein